MTRSLEHELMDDPSVTGPVLDRFHCDLARVHKLLGVNKTIERFLRKEDRPIRKVLDVGCGAGDLLRYLRARMNVEVIGVDQKPGASDIQILQADAIREPLPAADVAISSYFSHHLTPEENIALIRNVSRSCRRFVILDLVRHALPLTLFTIFICPLIGREAGADGRLSVRRAYTPDEFRDLVRTALAEAPGEFAIDVSPIRSRQVIDIRFTSTSVSPTV